MSKSTTSRPGSGRTTQRPDTRPGKPDKATSRRGSTSTDGFVESADFLPDWLGTKNAVPEQLGVAHQQTELAAEPEDSLAAQLAALEQLYEREPPATPAVFDADPVDSDDIRPLTTSLLVERQAEATPNLAEAIGEMAEPELPAEAPSLEPAPAPMTESPIMPPMLHETKQEQTPQEVGHRPSPIAVTPIVAAPVAIAPVIASSPTTGSTAIPGKKAEALVEEEEHSLVAETRVTPNTPPSPVRPRQKRQRTRKVWREGGVQRIPVRIFDRFAQVLLTLAILLGLLTFLIFWFNPFAYLALRSATVARPQTPRQAAEVPSGNVQWCLMGDFGDDEAENMALSDNGGQGDIVAGDRIFSISRPIAEPGIYLWQVASCNDAQILFPPEPAWIVTTNPDQQVTFTIDTTRTNPARFIATRYVVAASDSADEFQVVGDFQNWNLNDPTGTLQPIEMGIYQHIRRISEPGRYNAYVIAPAATDETAVTAIDGFGRTTRPIPLSFRTLRRSDFVVFQLDQNQGQVTVLYNMLPLLAQLAFGGGNLITGAAVSTATFLIALWLLTRSMLLWRHKSWLDAGCPRCHENELMRVERQPIDRWLHLFGLPVYRYQCRQCTWQGIRLSVGGLSVSPRSRLARAQER